MNVYGNNGDESYYDHWKKETLWLIGEWKILREERETIQGIPVTARECNQVLTALHRELIHIDRKLTNLRGQ